MIGVALRTCRCDVAIGMNSTAKGVDADISSEPCSPNLRTRGEGDGGERGRDATFSVVSLPTLLQLY